MWRFHSNWKRKENIVNKYWIESKSVFYSFNESEKTKVYYTHWNSDREKKIKHRKEKPSDNFPSAHILHSYWERNVIYVALA